MLLMKAKKTSVVWESVERSNRKKLRYGQWKIYFHQTSRNIVTQKRKRTGKLLMFESDFSKLRVCSKSVTKTLYGKFLVAEDISKLVCHCESCRWSEICCPLEILVKNLWTDCWIVTAAYLKKSSHQRCSVK